MASYDLDIEYSAHKGAASRLLNVDGMLPGDAVQAVITGHARVPRGSRPVRHKPKPVGSVVPFPRGIVDARQHAAQSQARKQGSRAFLTTPHVHDTLKERFTIRHKDAQTEARYVFPGGDEVSPRRTPCSCLRIMEALNARHHVLKDLLSLRNAVELAHMAVEEHVIPPPPFPLPVLRGRDGACACSVLGPTMVRSIIGRFPEAERQTWRSVGVNPDSRTTKLAFVKRKNASLVSQWKSERAAHARDIATHEYVRGRALGHVRGPTYDPIDKFGYRQWKRGKGLAHTNMNEHWAINPIVQNVAMRAVAHDPLLSRMVARR
jgi:hypothetical protein